MSSDTPDKKDDAISVAGDRSTAIVHGIGDGVVEIGDSSNFYIMGGHVIGRDIIASEIDAPVISGEQAFERIGAAVRLNLSQLERNIEQARRESSQFFKLTLIFSSIGFLIVLAGVILLFIGQVTAGIVTTISSIIPEVTALLFFNKVGITQLSEFGIKTAYESAQM